MNVAFDRWIPVVDTLGNRKLASLREVLTEGEKFVDLAVRPHERVSLMRLFICVAHAALNGPKDYEEWINVPKRLPEAAKKYLKDWGKSFELFHETKPWLQVAGLSKSANGKVSETETKDWTPVSKLNFSFASGNNTTLFDHGGVCENRNISIIENVLSMLTYQCFSPAGLISQVYWNGIPSGKSSKDAPCVPASMIHAFLREKDLMGTIHLNLPTFEDIRFNYGEQQLGRPVWEMQPTSLTDSVKLENATATYLGRLVPMTRLIRLHSSGERMLMGDGLVYPPFTDGFPAEPTATVIVRKNGKKEERALLTYRPERALWRELAAVVVKRRAGESGGPLSLCNIQEGKECDLIVAALARDNATIIDTAESVFHVPIRLRTLEGTASYETEVKKSESWESRLEWAVEEYRREVDGGWEGRLKGAGPSKWKLKEKLHAIATIHYWTTVEKNLPLLITHIKAIGSDAAIPTRKKWRRMLFKAAKEVYSTACGQGTPRQMRAFAKGLEVLTKKRDEIKTKNHETKEVET